MLDARYTHTSQAIVDKGIYMAFQKSGIEYRGSSIQYRQLTICANLPAILFVLDRQAGLRPM